MSKGNMVGKKYNKLQVLEVSEKRDSSGAILYKCKCDCGNIAYVAGRYLKSGHTKSCGCIRKEKFRKYVENIKLDLTGKIFGRLRALKYVRSTMEGKPIWLCKCECGNTKEILGESLISGNTKSCGCLSKEHITKENEKNFVENTNIPIIKKIIKDNTSKITKSGVKGVGWDKKRKKWRAYIVFQNKYYHLGYFTNLEVAKQVRKEAEENLFGNFLEWYKNKK